MEERRMYERVDVNIEGNFYPRKDTIPFWEITGTIDDVSEDGLKISVSFNKYEGLYEVLSEDDHISVQILDDVGLAKQEEIVIFYTDVIIKRKNLIADRIVLGCKADLHDMKYKEYVKKKKVRLFLGGLTNAY